MKTATEFVGDKVHEMKQNGYEHKVLIIPPWIMANLLIETEIRVVGKREDGIQFVKPSQHIQYGGVNIRATGTQAELEECYALARAFQRIRPLVADIKTSVVNS